MEHALFMLDNALSDALRYIRYIKHQLMKSGTKNDKLMPLPPCSRDVLELYLKFVVDRLTVGIHV